MSAVTFHWFESIGALAVDTGGPYADIWYAPTVVEAVRAYNDGAPADTVSLFDYALGERRPNVVQDIAEYLEEVTEG